jgi:hypothetical protein
MRFESATGSEQCEGSFDPRAAAVRLVVSDLQPLSTADLLGPDSKRFAARVITLVSGSHDYSPPRVPVGKWFVLSPSRADQALADLEIDSPAVIEV